MGRACLVARGMICSAPFNLLPMEKVIQIHVSPPFSWMRADDGLAGY